MFYTYIYIVWHLIISQHFMNMTALPHLTAYRLQQLGLSDQVKQNNINTWPSSRPDSTTRLDVPYIQFFVLGCQQLCGLWWRKDYQTLCVPAVASLLSFSLFFSPLDYAKQAYILPLKWGKARHSSAASGTACQNKQVKKDRVHAEVNKMAAVDEVS